MTHHFTHSSSPTEPWLETTTRLRGTPYKNALDALPLGAEVTMAGPNGFFTLRDAVPRAAFLAGGIGITTVRSILRALADRGDDRPLLLLYGNHDEDGIAFDDELADLTPAAAGSAGGARAERRRPHVAGRPRIHRRSPGAARSPTPRRLALLPQRPAADGDGAGDHVARPGRAARGRLDRGVPGLQLTTTVPTPGAESRTRRRADSYSDSPGRPPWPPAARPGSSPTAARPRSPRP